MAKQKSSGWLDKYTAAVSDATAKAKPGPVFLGNPYTKEMAKRQTYLSPKTTPTSTATTQAGEDRAQSEKTSDLNKKIATYAQNIGGALELAAPFTGFAMPILGAVGTGLDVGGSAYLASKDISEGNYGSAITNAGFGALGAAGFAPMVKYNRGLNAAVNTVDDVSDVAGLYNSYDNVGREYAGKIHNSKSEIDWAKWNKEIPSNKPLMQEYRTIEQSSKANNTWMKNADGSLFKGTPEQFVQQQSKNFKKAFPQGSTKFYRGSNQHIDDFVNRQRADWALFGSDNPNVAKTYANNTEGSINFYTPETSTEWGEKGLYELAFPNEAKIIEGQGGGRDFGLLDYNEQVAKGTKSPRMADVHNENLQYNWNNGNHYNYTGDMYDPTRKYLSTDSYANYVKNTNNPETVARIRNVIDGPKDLSSTVYAIDAERLPIKSLRGNNGMFNMNNSNIYKSIAPIIGAGAVASQFVDQKKDGGWLDKYNDGGPVQPNYNDASVSMSDNFVGNGYSNVGRNYSPAWGGQFAMGGSMPGAVGFMYARTNDPAPSKGPYGKKTPASAQNGMEMKYYQEGLDFKPKSISKDGATIYNPKTKIGFDKISAKDYIAVPPKPVATPNYNMFDKFVLGTDAFVKDVLDYKTYLKGADIVAGSAIKGLRNLGVPVPDAAKEFFFNKVRPVSYPTDLISAAREVFRSDKAPPAKDSSGNLRVDEEAWSMAMGRPTQSKYIVPSKYKPSSAKDPNAKYHTFAKGVIDPKVLTNLVSDDKFWNKYKQVNKSGKEYLPSVSLEPYLTDSFKKEYIKTANDEFSQTDPLANFQIYRGVDPKTKKKYAAISDVYDFGLETANALTNPINFYDRFYYKDGGPIKDDRGQWAHPGKVTQIGSNQITMQGVPYPVLGISDTGDTQMMYPNQDYNYHGSSVTEYPMMRKGGQTPKINNETLARNQRIARADAASKEPFSAESLAVISDAIPDRRRFSEEIKSISPGISNWIDNNPVASYIDRNLNPSVVAGKIVSNFGHIPLNIKQGDYEQALLNFVSPLALISGAPATKNLLNPNNNKKLSGPSVASTYEQGGQLTKLDQLTNFTNYNTKQPGGWLDKYQ